MTAARSSLARRSLRSGRGALIALVAGTGVALTPLPALAHTTTASAPVAHAAPLAAPNRAAQVAVNTALAQVGDRYVWGAAGPHTFDCSGLVLYAYKAAGIRLPHSSRMQSTMGTPVSRADLKPGDLVFFYHPVRHVAIYIGNGEIVQAANPRRGVNVMKLSSMPGYAGARRVA